jgi:hypothetical protein
MRPRVVLGILAAGCALVLGLVVSKMTMPKPTASAPAPAPAAPPAPVTVPPPAPVAVAPPVPLVATNQNTNATAMTAEQHDEYVQKRANELLGIAMYNDYAKHQEIIREMTNSDPDIRKAAVAAVVQTSDRQLIPEIQQIADSTDDPDYKDALEKAIAFMKLPTLTEMMQKAKADRAAGIATPQSPFPPPAQTDPGIPPATPTTPGP